MKKTNKIKSLIAIFLIISSLALFTGCGKEDGDVISSVTKIKSGDVSAYKDAVVIELDGDKASANGSEVTEYDYTWHVDPSVAHKDVKNAPAEYYTGSLPDELPDVYIDHELYYFPELDQNLFKLVNYDGENEWAYYYNDGENDQYIFATLPNLGQSFQTDMMHSEEEALKNKVLHITKAGTYILEGDWDGQVRIDLGDEDETFTDENAKVTLVLNGANIKCTVAPGVIFGAVYECDNTWEDQDEHSNSVDTKNAGANVIIADGSTNIVDGKNVYRMLKTKYKDESSTDAVKLQKKMRKTDGAFYSYVSMNISGGTKGDGVLQINSGFEGLDSELHLTINSGNIIINSYDDGSNVNEDNVSVWTLNGGTLVVNASSGPEGDGIDSNGYIVINGGTAYVNNVTTPDSAFDSEDGVTYNGGKIYIDGKLQEYTAGQTYHELSGNGNGQGQMGPGGQGGNGQGGNFNPESFQNFDIKEFKEKVAALGDDATIQDVMNLLGMGGGNGQGQGGQDPGTQGQGTQGNIPGGNGQQGQGTQGQGTQGNIPGGQIPGNNGGNTNGQTNPPEIPNASQTGFR